MQYNINRIILISIRVDMTSIADITDIDNQY